MRAARLGAKGIVRSITVSVPWQGFSIATGELRQSRYLMPDGTLIQGLRQRVHGHGMTREQSRQSCLGEAAERHSLVWQGEEQLLLASAKELGSEAVPVKTCILHSQNQFAAREQWAARHGSFQWVPEKFDSRAEILWARVRHSRTNDEKWAPAELCFLGFPGKFLYSDTNGCAAGPTEAEAEDRAWREAVERDAVALWWYSRARRPEVELDHPARAIMGRARRRFWMLDLTHDLGVPVVVAISCDREGGRISLGSAAGESIEEAAAKAAGEMLMVQAGLRHSNTEGAVPNSNEGALRLWYHRATLDGRDYLKPASAEKIAPNPAKARPPYWVKTLTKADCGVPVVRVIAPGLRHWWARLGPGRLYDVPPRIGWIPKKLREEDLNPEPYLL